MPVAGNPQRAYGHKFGVSGGWSVKGARCEAEKRLCSEIQSNNQVAQSAIMLQGYNAWMHCVKLFVRSFCLLTQISIRTNL